MSKYNVNGLPWSSGIGTDVSDCKTSRDVMQKAKLLWNVHKCPIMAKMPFMIGANNETSGDDFAREGNIYRQVENAYATFRTDINQPLGLVKKQYEIVQNSDAFSFFDEVVGESDAIWDRAGYFGIGNKVFVSAKLSMKTDVNGDPVDNYLVFSNNHDGGGSVNILFTPIRVICTNMLNGSLMRNDCYIRIKHTKSVKERFELGKKILRISCERASFAKNLYLKMADIKMDDRNVMKYIARNILNEEEYANVINFDNKNGFERLVNKDYICLETTGISTRKANIISNTFEYYNDGIGQKDIYGTGWGAYNAVTGFYSNVANLEGEKRMESLVYGNANSNMIKAANNIFKFAV